MTTNAASNWNATWSPDGSRIIYASSQGGPAGLWQKAAGGGGSEELILKLGVPLDWSSDGRFLLFMRDEDLWVLSDPRVSSDRTPMPLTRTKFSERDGRFSPDVRWVAVQSDESGQNEIYVQSFEVSSTTVSLGGNKTVVSTQGGTEPRWRADGKELFYVGADRRMMAVPVTATSGVAAFRAGIPQPLFAMPESVSWDVAADGQRFLFTLPDGKGTPPPFTVVLNWQAGLKK